MPPLPERPTWKLGDEDHPATYPAALLDPDTAIAEALAEKGYYSGRSDDVTTLQNAALAHAGECMADALVKLAFRALEAGPDVQLENSAGWKACLMPATRQSSIELLLVHPSEPGAWHIDFQFRGEMTPEAEARAKEIDALMEAAGVDISTRVLASLTRKPFPHSEELRALEADPASWRSPGRGSRLSEVIGTAIDLGSKDWNGIGPGSKPRDVEGVETLRSFAQIDRDSGWWKGIQLRLKPVPDCQRNKGELKPQTGRDGACPHVPAALLSDFIRTQGLMPLVAPRAELAGSLPWICFGNARHAALDDAGHAIVHASGGLFDEAVVARIRGFSAQIAACDVEFHLPEWKDLAVSLTSSGITSSDNSFDCNDLRDISHATHEGSVLSNWNRTQHGRFRLDLHLDEDGEVGSVLAVRNSGGADHVVGRFRREADALQPDYGPENGPEVSYTIGNIRDMNGIISSLSSVACCWEEENARRKEDDSPSPV